MKKLYSNEQVTAFLLEGSLHPTSTLRQLAQQITAPYTLLYIQPVELGAYALERMLQVIQDTNAGMLYSDCYKIKDGRQQLYPTIDYQEGSLRDDFDFGALTLYQSDALKAAVAEMKVDYQSATLYDLRLKIAKKHRIVHLSEPLYTVPEIDNRKSGEKLFDYVDPKNRQVQIEMEQVCTQYLKDINAWLAPDATQGVCHTPTQSDKSSFPVEATVVIPVRNREKTIEDAVRSVLTQQTDFSFNLIVVDNHSTDQTTAILQRLAKEDPRLIHLIPERNDLNIGGCWNVAIMHAQCGKFAIQLDSDDLYIDNQVISRIVNAFYEQNCAMVVGSYRMVDFKLQEIPPGLIDHKEWTEDNGRNNALRINGLGAPRAFYTPVLREIKFPNTGYGEDYAVGLAVSRNYRIGRIYEALYLCRRWDDNSDAALDINKTNANNLYKDKIRTIELLARMKKLTLILLAVLMSGSMLFAQSPKREMRASWIATVGYIDWPKATGAAAQQAELITMLDSMKTMNMNTIFFQVRSRCDAMYNSAYEPWSSDLHIARGTNPGYDPLAFAIQECHKRGIECHAWMNPYRYNNTANGWTGANDHPLNYEQTHPDWLLHYSANVTLDPAIPEVRAQIKNVIGDVLSKYDLDGIIFDDYFYAYGGTTTQDAASVTKYKPATMDVHDWRRDNVNRMIADVYDTIQAVKPWVTFGVSPFGIWTTNASAAAKEGIALPSGITGGNMYQEIYCDPVAWLKEGTVDYISPQLYWKTGGAQAYEKLCPWWANLANRFGVYFYSSMANYKYAEKTDAAYTVSELSLQSTYNRQAAKDNAPGHVFYNTRAWVFDKPFRTEFKTNLFQLPALTPPVGWKPAPLQKMVTFNSPQTGNVTWIYNETPDSVKYAVYIVPNANRSTPGVFASARFLAGVTYTKSYTLPAGVSTSTHKIAVSVIDRYGNEYAPRVLGEGLAEQAVAQLTTPANATGAHLPVIFKWNKATDAENYVWQLARDENFTDIVASRETTDLQFNTSTQLNIKEDNGTYYWRVRARKANAADVWSAVNRVVLGTGTDMNTLEAETLQAGFYDNNLVIDAVGSSPATIRIYNLAGALLAALDSVLQSGKNTIAVPQISSQQGILLVNIRTDQQETTLKIYK
ncbi:hypothetical protein FACS1894162_3040 [Bacteroidia bacterium]|nr:hypothetical protein FACS1894162_3040 [Bacteroidia bacterium]